MRVLSVNVGHPQLNPWKTMKLTGIDKRPVDGPVKVTRPRAKGMGMVGLAGDRVYDVRNHGGPDQAVYAYAREDLDFWAAELDLLPRLLVADALPEELKDLARRRTA
jgi:MOSC domain-containing protein YiiM